MRLTDTQKRAVDHLLALKPDEWKSYGPGMGKYRVALRHLFGRTYGLIELEVRPAHSRFQSRVQVEKFRLTDAGRAEFGGTK